MVLLLVGTYALVRDSMRTPLIESEPEPPVEVLSPSRLATDERIVIDYVSSGCRGGNHWVFQLSGGPERRLAIIEAGDSWGNDRPVTGKPEPIGALILSETECLGLQHLFDCLRESDHQVSSTTTTELKITYYRGATIVGVESLSENGSIDSIIAARQSGAPLISAEGRVLPSDTISLYQLVQRARKESEEG